MNKVCTFFGKEFLFILIVLETGPNDFINNEISLLVNIDGFLVINDFVFRLLVDDTTFCLISTRPLLMNTLVDVFSHKKFTYAIFFNK